MAGVVWTAGSGVKVSGTINGVVTGTMDGTVSSINTSSHTLILSVSGENSENVQASPSGNPYNASQFKDLSVMLYTRKQDGTSKMINTANGAIASFTDGGNNVPVKQLVVDIEPVQDLHGYDYPWPAGGGKNLLHVTAVTQTSNGVTFTVNEDGTVKVNGTATANTYLYLGDSSLSALAEGSYILSGSPSGGAYTSYGLQINDGSWKFDYGSGASFTKGSTLTSVAIRIANGYTANNLLFKPMIRLSSVTDATFAPYENICPITGHTSAVVTRTGKNLLNAQDYVSLNNCSIDANGTVTATVSDSRAFSPVLQLWLNSTFVGFGTKISNTDFRFVKDATFNRIVFGHSGATKDVKITYNAESLKDGETYIFTEDIISSTNPLSWKNMMIRPASDTDATYKPYQGQTVTIDLNGTRYGGTLDVTTGVLTVDRGYHVVSNSDTTRLFAASLTTGVSRIGIVVSDMKAPTWNVTKEELDVISNIFTPNIAPLHNASASAVGQCCLYKDGSYPLFVAAIPIAASANNAKAWLVTNGCTFVYPLATPFTVQLTPAEVRTLSGYNNIWSNTGDTNLIYETSQYDTTSNYNVGIWMNCYDQANSSSTIRVYNGSSRWPNVFLGNMTNADLPRVNGNEPYGYGLYSDNVFLRGIISATGGLIGNWTIGTTGMFYNSDAPGSTSITMIPGGTTASTTSIGGSSGSKSWIFTGKNLFGIDTTGKLYASSAVISGDITATSGTIGGVTANNSYGLYTNSKTSATSTNTGFLISKDGAIYLGAYNSTNQACPFQVTNAGFLTATSGKIGGWTIGISSLYSGTHSAYDSNVDGIFMDSTYLAGGKQAMWYLKNDGSAKIGAMTLSSDGTLAVPAANITGSFSVGKIDGLSDSLSNIENTANAALGQSVWYATCSTEAATTAKVATISPTTTNFTLKAGAVVNVSFTNTNSGAVGSITLNVNNTGAKNIKYINNNSITNIPGVGYILANRTYQFVYDGTYWVIQNLNTYTDTINRTKYDIVIRANGTITAGHIICGTSNGYVDIGASVSFDLSYPLLYAATGLSTGGTGSNNYLQINDINAANNGTIVGGAAYKTLYLKGKVSNNTFTISSSQYLTTTPPTSIDNLYYIPLGTFKSGSTTNIYFNSSSRLYAYINGAFQPVDMAVRRYITDISSGGIKVSYATNPINYLQIVPSGINIFKNDNQIASYGSSIILGELADGKTHVEIDSDSFDVCSGANTGANSTKLATFGAESVIGNMSARGVSINDKGFKFNNGGKTAFYVGVDTRSGSTSQLSTDYYLASDPETITVNEKDYYYVTTVPVDRTVIEVGHSLPLIEDDGEEYLVAADCWWYHDWIINDDKLWIADIEDDEMDESVCYIYTKSSSMSAPYCIIGKNAYSLSNAAGNMSFAQGHECMALGAYSTSVGWKNLSSGTASISSGNQSKAYGSYSFAGGFMSNTQGNNTFAYGYKANACCESSIAFGNQDYEISQIFKIKIVSHNSDTDEITCNITEDADYFEMCLYQASILVTTDNNYIFESIEVTSGSGSSNITFVCYSRNKNIPTINSYLYVRVDPAGSYGEGAMSVNSCCASDRLSTALGLGTVAPAAGLAIGQFNIPQSNVLFSVGNGSAQFNRNNAMTVDMFGNVKATKFQGEQKVLWTGAWYMTANHIIYLPELISEQSTGIMLVWSGFGNNVVQNYDWFYQFIPKYHGVYRSGSGVTSGLITNTPGGTVGTKYLMIYNDHIQGHDNNSKYGTYTGITYNNSHWVLRAVVGV